MTRQSRQGARRLLEWWVRGVQRHPVSVVVIAVLITAGALFYSIRNFSINTDMNSMISEKLRFRQLDRDFSRVFPQLSDTLVVVLDGDTPEQALAARARMAEQFRKETRLFKSVYEPGGGIFFEKNGLLYLDVEDLEDLADRLADAQPLIAFLSRDLSLRGLFSVLGMALNSPELKGMPAEGMDLLFDRMGKAFDASTGNRPYQISWQEMMLGEKEIAEQRRQFIILQPVLVENDFSAGEEPLAAVRRVAEQLGIRKANGVTMRVTGDVALSHETITEARNTMGAATAASLILVGIVLFIGLGGSGRLAFAGITTLIIGLIWTACFALAFFGGLNMISITFAVLFIGLGVDYSIQFCLRYRELVLSGSVVTDSILTTAKGVGRMLILSCVTTAIGFYSFVPTAYSGVAQLGAISGTGMFISLFVNLTVLPALLALFPFRKGRGMPWSPSETLLAFPYRHYRRIAGGALILGLGATVFLPAISFDYNPLNLYNQTSESILTIKDLFARTESQPWTISVLAPNKDEARKLSEKLNSLKEVKMTVTLADFVPDNQQEKLRIISDIALFMPPGLDRVAVKHPGHEQDIRAFEEFRKRVKASVLSSSMANPSLERLHDSMERFHSVLKDPERAEKAFAALDKSLLSNLPMLFERLETSLRPSRVRESDLPRQLSDQYVAADGRCRVQVVPRENILDSAALRRFVLAVRSVAPDAIDAPVTIYESGRAVVTSFIQATLYALVVITLFLLIELRSFSVTGLILLPLVLAILLTAASSVLLGIPLNFANVIVVPLLLGVGVHSGIIFILRYQTEPRADGNMLKTSTARALLISTLTTLISTGSLAFSPHRGIASMGKLLSICFGFLILSLLVLLPASIKLFKVRPGGREGEKKSL